VVEVLGDDYLAAIVPLIVNAVLNEHQLVIDVITFVARGDFPRSRLGEKQRGKILSQWVTRKLSPRILCLLIVVERLNNSLFEIQRMIIDIRAVFEVLVYEMKRLRMVTGTKLRIVLVLQLILLVGDCLLKMEV
jgi:hypothetical protein